MRVFGKLARRHTQEGDGSCRDLKKNADEVDDSHEITDLSGS